MAVRDGGGSSSPKKPSNYSGGRQGSPSIAQWQPGHAFYTDPRQDQAMYQWNEDKRNQNTLAAFLQAVWRPPSGGGGYGGGYSRSSGGGRRSGGGGGSGQMAAALKARYAAANTGIDTAMSGLDKQLAGLNDLTPPPYTPETYGIDPRMLNDLRGQGADVGGLTALNDVNQQSVNARNLQGQWYQNQILEAFRRAMQERMASAAMIKAGAKGELANTNMKLGG